MRRFLWLPIALLLSLPVMAPAQGQGELPHAFLLGSWVGGMYPPPTTLSGKECLAQPTVIFTRDAVLRASAMDVTYIQSLVETVRDVGKGVEFRLVPASGPTPAPGPFGLGPQQSAMDHGFGCGAPGLLRVQKRSDHEIVFPQCTDFPYPLVRCPN